MIGHWIRRPRRHFSQAMIFLAVSLQSAPLLAADKSLENYRNLKPIASFGSISVSVHSADAKSPAPETALSSEALTRYLQLQVASHFPDVPHSGGTDPKDQSVVGYLLCRVWLDVGSSPAVFQVKCQISTSTHISIIDDVSFGYGPKEKVPAIIREQIDQILKGFAVIFFRVREEM